MGTVSQDDEIVQRGANPRTGLVTPFITTDRSTASSEDDYINTKARHLIRRHRISGRWKQENAGWSLTDSPLPSPVVQSMNKSRTRRASAEISPDKFVVDMPGVDNPFPPQMTDEQIRDCQEGLRSIYELGGKNNEAAEHGLPSAHPALPRTLRKAVRSAISGVDGFPGRQLRIKEKTGLSCAPLLDESTNKRFLGTIEPTTPPSQPIRLSQYLPKISLLHPSLFSSPLSYRRPTELLPSRLHPSPLSPRASSTVTRPKVHRQDGAIKVPSVRSIGDFGTEANQFRAPSTVAPEVAINENAGMMLETVRAKLRTSQTCDCSRCAVSKARPFKRGDAVRVPCLEGKNGRGVFAVPFSEKKHGTPEHTTPDKHKASSGGRTQSRTGFGVSNNNADSAGNPAHSSGLARSGSFVRRAESITALLDTVPLPDLVWIQHCLTQVLEHVVLAFWRAPPALKALRRADARVEEYAAALKQVLVAAVYFVILLKTALTLVKVLALIWKILALISWPARVVGVMFGWCVLG